jgi:hypothetical protein
LVLGVAKATLSRWTGDYKQAGNESFPGKGNTKSSEEELRALRKELNHVRQERDILKNPPKGSPFSCEIETQAYSLVELIDQRERPSAYWWDTPLKNMVQGVRRIRHWRHVSDPV